MACTPVAKNDSPPAVEDYSAEAFHWADSVASSLTDEEMAAQVLMPAIYSDASPEAIERLSFYTDSLKVGGAILLKGVSSDAKSVASRLAESSPRGILIAIDAEWGLAMRISDAPEFPRNSRISPAATEQDMYDYGYELARQAREIGINVIFGPVMDVDIPEGGIMRSRCFGSDPVRVARLGTSFARGLEDGNVISVAKHFPGHGSAPVDSHNARPVIGISRERLDSVDLVPFREYINEGLSGVMIGHLSFTAIDSVARSAVVSPQVISGLLRKEMGFKGLVFTDALNMRGLGKEAKPVRDALLAGADIILAPSDSRKAISEITESIADGSLPREIIRERCRRILFMKYSLGLNKTYKKSEKRNPELYTPLTRKIIERLEGKEGSSARL